MNVDCTSQKRIAIVQPAVDKCLDFEKKCTSSISPKRTPLNLFRASQSLRGRVRPNPTNPPPWIRPCDENENSPSQMLDPPGKSCTEEFRAEQWNDVTLQRAWTQARSNKGHFYVRNGLLFHRDQVLGHPVQQRCVQQKYVAEICRMAHDSYHQGAKRRENTR